MQCYTLREYCRLERKSYMEIVNLTLPSINKFATAYLNGTEEINKHFHYNYQEQQAYKERLEELKGRTFRRADLAEHIRAFMEPFPTSSYVEKSLEKLKQDNSVVVIGGQQAGILTGPLYSIHKVISIISLAKQKETELGVPVVPVFWIAGEDHDYAEVNHIYVPNNNRVTKWTYPTKIKDKRMITDCLLNEEACFSWVKDIIEVLGETDYTKELLAFSEKAIKGSRTFVDFFAYIMMELFKEDGLLLIDSGDRKLRRLEKEILIEQVKDAEKITKAVLKQQQELAKDGFNKGIEMSEQAANLFFYDEEYFERILLEYDQDTHHFMGKNGAHSFSYEAFLTMANEQPEKISNNVVTRPLMQEKLFPTLAFIAGPGEIAYWSELKEAFELFDMKMPPIVPRLNLTLLDRDIESQLTELQLDLHRVLQFGVSEEKEAYLQSVRNEQYEALFLETKLQLQNNYEKINKLIEIEYPGLIPLFKKNEGILLEQLSFMEGKVEETLKIKHDVSLAKFEKVENSLRPLGGPQERSLNVYYYLNKYGLGFVQQLTSLDFEFDGTHKVVKI